MNILVGDIGATQARFGVFYLGEEIKLIKNAVLLTQDYNYSSSLIDALKDRLLGDSKISLAIIGVAGPILKNIAYPPHINFGIDGDEVKRLLAVSEVLLVNDMLLHSYASLSPHQKGLHLIKIGQVNEGQRGIFAPGTGFGQCGLIRLRSGTYKAVLSEGGHCPFPFKPEEKEYMKFLIEEFKIEPTFDNVVSGPGLLKLYSFLRQKTISSQQLGETLKLDKEFGLWTAKFMGRAAKQVALTYLSLEGLYISGGVVLKNPWILKQDEFFEEFVGSDTMFQLLEKIPIWLIEDELATLWGGAYYVKFGHNI